MASTRVALTQPSSTGDTSVYTVPSGKRLLLSTLVLRRRGSGTVAVSPAIKSGGTTYYQADFSMATGTRQVLREWWILDAGDELVVYQDTANSITVQASGILFDV